MNELPDELARFKAVRDEPCPDAETLVAYEALGEDERRNHPAFAHVELCMHCQSLLEAMSLGRPDTIEEERAWKSVESSLDAAVLSRLPQRPAARNYRAWAAVAASLVLAVGLYAWRGQESGARETDYGVRGSEIQLVGPTGSAALPFEFRWASPVLATKYRVEILDSAGRPLATRLTTSEQLASAELGALLEPGGDYRWRVIALDENGEEIVASTIGTFRIPLR